MRQQVVQLGLADENDLNEFLRIRLEVGDEPYLLQDVPRQVLRFIDHEHDILSAAPRVQEECVKSVDELFVAVAVRSDAEIPVYRTQKLGRAERRVQNERADRVLVEPIEEIAAQSGLARADLPVMTMKPPRWRSPNSRCAKASLCLAER